MAKPLGPSPPFKVLTLTVVAASLPLLLLALFPNQLYWIADVPAYLLFHNAAEGFGILVSLSIFGVGWFVYDLSRDRHTLFLSTAFLAIGLMDFMHTLSFPGMPDFLTPNSADKTSRFWVLTRLFAATAFLASAFIDARTDKRWLAKLPLLTLALAATGVVFAIVVIRPEFMPPTFFPGSGQTLFKKSCEYLVIVLLAAAALAYSRRMQKTDARQLLYYTIAFVISMFSELAFTLYQNVFDSFNALGHLYKIAAFQLIYRGVLFTSIETPYAGLSAANSRLSREIDERKRTEQALRQLNRELRAISNCNQVLMRAENEQSLLDEVCRIICDEAGYRMAWVGYVEHDDTKTVLPVARGGVDDGYLAGANITWADTARGSGPTGTAARTGRSDCIQNFVSDDRAAPWRQQALQRGYRSSIALALNNEDGLTFGVLTIYSQQTDRFTGDEVRLLEELAGDLAFGIMVLRARAELAQAQASQAQLAAIVEFSNDAIIGKTPDGIITHWNNSAERIYGYRGEEIIGRHVTQLAPPSRHAEINEFLSKIRNGETVVNHESQRVRKDGTLIEVAVTLSPIKDRAGHISGISTIARDISEKKHIDEQLREASLYHRNLIETSLDPLVTINPQGKITDVNRATEEVTGRPRGELIGTDFSDYFTEPAKALAGYRRVLENGFVTDYPLAIRHRDGPITDVVYNACVYRDQNGQVLGIFAAARDITERKRAEEQLKRYRDHLEEEVQQRTADLTFARNAAEAANQAKSAFLANMSHELRTPLNAILGFSSMMRKDTRLSDNQRQNLDIINHSGEHLLTLINDVLEMSKIEAGRVQLDNAPFDLGGMVRDVTDMMRIRANEKGLRLSIDQASYFPRYIVGDEARLRQILINLMGNAIKFTERGAVILRLSTRENKISHLQIEVEDSGSGIAAENQQRIFEPFEQLGEQAVNKGTGLGLTITRQFVQLMGGNISLESTPGKGSLFRVDLPLRETSGAELPRGAPPSADDIPVLAPGQPDYRILIVEDQLENRLLLTQLMEALGLRVQVAEHGQQAIQLFQSWHPDLIWMDRQMPVMDGLEATRRIRGLPGGKRVKIVAVTASAFQEQREESLKAGMDDFVRKPYRFEEIYQCLSKHLGLEYSDRVVPANDSPVADLTPAMLQVLPETLRNELRVALERLDSDQITRLLLQVGDHDPSLRKILALLADNYDYPTILNALTVID